jgi:hypothetical protein
MRVLIERLLNEMPWVEANGVTYDLELEKVKSKQEALTKIQKLMKVVKDKEEFVKELFTTFKGVMASLGITEKEVR